VPQFTKISPTTTNSIRFVDSSVRQFTEQDKLNSERWQFDLTTQKQVARREMLYGRAEPTIKVAFKKMFGVFFKYSFF
jgi:hypothetical protein